MSKKPSKEKLIEVLEQANGLVKPAAIALGVARVTLYDWIRKDPDVQQAQIQAREAIIDLAESKLVKNINDGDNTSIIFFLKTVGRNRGYIEKRELDQTITNKPTIVFENVSKKYNSILEDKIAKEEN